MLAAAASGRARVIVRASRIASSTSSASPLPGAATRAPAGFTCTSKIIY